MNHYKSYTVNMPTTEQEEQDYIIDIERRTHNIIYPLHYYYDQVTRTIFNDYYQCKQCYTIFQILELIEKYHEVFKSSIKLFEGYFIIRKKIRSFIEQLENQQDKCKCCFSQHVEYIDDDTGLIYLIHADDEHLWENSLFKHYNRLLKEPNILNEEIHNKYLEIGNKYLEMEDNHLALIFNDDDKIITYNGTYNIYNTRQQYRLKMRNFLKLSIHTYISNNDISTIAELKRDSRDIINEFKFWDEYFSKPHPLLITTILSLKGKINYDCIYNIIMFLKK